MSKLFDTNTFNPFTVIIPAGIILVIIAVIIILIANKGKKSHGEDGGER